MTRGNRKARSYALTPGGKEQVTAGKLEWNRMLTTMQPILSEPS